MNIAAQNAIDNIFRGIYYKIRDVVVPPACPLCHAMVAEEGVCVDCWQGLEFISAPICRISGIPMPYDLGEETISPLMWVAPPPYKRARAALHYEGKAADLIRRFKFGDRPEIARLLARLMFAAGAEFWEGAAVLVPVPLHRWRLIGRRFNQAAEIGRALEQLTGFEMCLNTLVRTRATKRQIGLTRNGRKRNLRGAFAVADKARLAGKRVVLLDDVLTTGATVEACSKVLLRGGASEVDVLTAARVVMPERLSAA